MHYKIRREIILSRLLAHEALSLAGLTSEFDANPQSIRDDIRAIEKTNPNLTIEKNRTKKLHYKLISRSYQPTILEENRNRNKQGKEVIARTALPLFSGSTNPPLSSVQEKLTRELERWKSFPETKKTAEDSLTRLGEIWKKRQRTAALDSGSTNEELAIELSQITLPRDDLDSLEIISNSRTIFSTIGEPSCAVKAAIVGGTQKHSTESIVGPRALKCLDAWGTLNIDVAFIGASNVNLTKSTLDSIDEGDNEVKKRFLKDAMVKVILADRDKFQFHRADQFFSRLPSVEHVSLIISDSLPDCFRGDNWRKKVAELIGTPLILGDFPE